jgi:glucose-6-phosphate 1-dehydrogenase
MTSLHTSSTIVIFGASGDLTRRKLIPALFNLYCKDRLPPRFQVVGFSRKEWSMDEFREKMLSGVQEFSRENLDQKAWKAFAQNLHYLTGNLSNSEDYLPLDKYLDKLAEPGANRLYYLATPPRFFPPIISSLGDNDMVSEGKGWRRVVIEKPFGQDLSSARALNAIVHSVLDEGQVYRIDHFLAKETVQNILVFRFGNTIFEPIWNRNYIDHVQITASETVDVGHRAGYYDQAGVLRDMFQNHLLQLLTLVSMEPPASFKADALRNEKVKVFSALRPIQPENFTTRTVRGQYKGYRLAPGVPEDSQTPTYAALQLFIDNWRWHGIPFYLRSGKSLAEKLTQILIQFKAPPHMMFPIPAEQEIKSNYLSLDIQPDEGIHLRFEAKIPDTAAEMRSVDMDFHYGDSFEAIAIPDAYERLILDALNGDASLFTRADGIELAWNIIDPIIHGWETDSAPPLTFYEPGSWGPEEGDDLLARDGRAWHKGCDTYH